MGVDFNAAFNQLNTNTTGESASILDAEEVKAAKQNSVWTVAEGMTAEQFKSANEHCARQDTDRNGTVTVREQKVPIAEQLKNVWTSHIARFFKDDIEYDNSSATAAQQVTVQAEARAQNALNYIEYAKQNNIDIFENNEGTGVEDKDNIKEFTDNNGTVRRYYTRDSSTKIDYKINDDGTHTSTYDDDATITSNENGLRLFVTSKEGSLDVEQTYKYNEDGSFSYSKKAGNGESWTNVQKDKNANMIKNTGFYTTARGNVKAYAKEGESADATLDRLGIPPEYRDAIMKANPKAAANGKFRTDVPDVYIPKAVIENMQQKGKLDEDKLAGKP